MCISIGVLPEDRSKLANVEQCLRARQNQLVVLDDMQRLPILFESLRGLIDHARRQHVHDKRIGCTACLASLGASWEGHVVESLLAVLPASVNASFYRSGAGAEIDLLLTQPDDTQWAIDAKCSATP